LLTLVSGCRQADAESNINQLGGFCETILYFDKDNQPVGYLW
jgi:hypothetical protein